MMTGASALPRASGEDIEILARTIFGEARNQSVAGQIAVGFVIAHRAAIAAAYRAAHGKSHPLFGDGSLGSACKAPWQFSCWNKSDPTRARMIGVTLDDAAYQRAFYVALAIVCGEVSDALPKSTHYYNPAAVRGIPAWTKDATFLATIGAHMFFGGVP